MLYAFVFSIINSFCSPLLVWNRLYFLSDSLSHSAILGLGIAIFFGLSKFLTFFISSFFVIFFTFKNKKKDHNATLIILTYFLLSAGLLLLFKSEKPYDLSFMFSGDLLLANNQDAIRLLFLLPLCIAVYRYRNSIILIAFEEDLAKIEGVKVNFIKILVSIFIAIFLCFSFESLGVFLTPGILIIPPLTAINLSKTPEQMIILSGVVTFISFALGIYLSYILDISASILVLLSSCLLYFFSKLILKFKEKTRNI